MAMQRLARLNDLADFDRAAADKPVRRGVDDGSLEIQAPPDRARPSPASLARRRQTPRASMRAICCGAVAAACACDRRLLHPPSACARRATATSRLARASRTLLPPTHTAASAACSSAVAASNCWRSGSRPSPRAAPAARDPGSARVASALASAEPRFRRRQLGAGRFDLAIGRLQAGVGVAGGACAHLLVAARAAGGHRHIAVRGARRRLRRGEIRLGLGHRELIVTRVELDEHVAGFHGLVVDDH